MCFFLTDYLKIFQISIKSLIWLSEKLETNIFFLSASLKLRLW